MIGTMKDFISSLEGLGERNSTFDDVCQTYKEFGDEIRKLCGGSAGGFTGLLECLIFLAVKKQLEKESGQEILAEEIKEDMFKHWVFKNKNLGLVMARDIQLSRIQKDSNANKRPDIAIYKNEKLIAVFSVKASVTSANTFLGGLQNDLKEYETANKEVMFFLALQGIESFADQERAKENRKDFLDILKEHRNVDLLVYNQGDKYKKAFLDEFGSLVIDLPDAVNKVVRRLK